MEHLHNTKKGYKNLNKQEIHIYYQNELDKACFQHEMSHGDFKDLTWITISDKILHKKAFNFTKNPKYHAYQRGLASMVYKFFDKKTASRAIKNADMLNTALAEELRKPVIRKFSKKSTLNFCRQSLGRWFCWFAN